MRRLDGIEERLKRANESVQNLDLEINRFLDESGNREIIEPNLKDVDKFKDFWHKQTIPTHLPVLVSEILHHYRATLDNLIWKFLRQAGQTPRNPNVIEFPIFSTQADDSRQTCPVQPKNRGSR